MFQWVAGVKTVNICMNVGLKKFMSFIIVNTMKKGRWKYMAWTQLQRSQYDALRYLLDTVDPYTEPLSNTQPWYDSISTGNLKECSHILQIDTFPIYRIFDFLIAYYGEEICISERSSRRSGYLPEQNENGQVMLIIPYRGRFGAGWIVATHFNNTTVNCKYCLLADGGLNHGTD